MAFLQGADQAISLSLLLAGPLCLWSGVMELLKESSVIAWLGRVLKPSLLRLFPLSSQCPLALGYLCGNVSANLLGLGNAATPMGIKAIGSMKQLSPPEMAQKEIYRLLVMNTASIQLIPTTLIALRTSQGCQTPWDVLPAVWVTSLCAVTAGLVSTYYLQRLWRDGIV